MFFILLSSLLWAEDNDSSYSNVPSSIQYIVQQVNQRSKRPRDINKKKKKVDKKSIIAKETSNASVAVLPNKKNIISKKNNFYRRLIKLRKNLF